MQELRTAPDEDQLVLHYQPKFDVRTGEVGSVEALVRWQHPTRGLLYPGSFLELVEDGGMMHTLTRTVLAKALNQAGEWQARGSTLGVSVNVPAASLLDEEFPGFVAGQLGLGRLPAEILQLEITEETLMADRSFVFPMSADARAAALVESTINLAHSLGLRMVAEGVEDRPTYSELMRYGCDQIQGFYISRPVPAAELDTWINARASLASGRAHAASV